MIILGLDPGIRNFGYAVLNDTKVSRRGVWTPPGKGKLLASQVLAYVLPLLAQLVAETAPEIAVIEEVVWRGMRRRITMPLSHVAGGALGLLVGQGVPVYLLTPGMKTRGVKTPRGWTEHEADAANLARRVHGALSAVGDSGRKPSEVREAKRIFAARLVPSSVSSGDTDGTSSISLRPHD